MAKSVGIELSEDRVQLTVLDIRSKRPTILDQLSVPILPGKEGNWKDWASEALKSALRERRIPRERVAVSIDSGNALLAEIHTPFSEEDKIAKTIRFEMENHLPSHSIDELVTDYSICEKGAKGALILGVALPRKIMRAHLDILTGSDIDPVAIDLDIFAVVNTLTFAGLIPTLETVIIVHGNPKYAKCVLIENGRLRALRTMRFNIPFPKQSEETPTPPERKFSDLDGSTRNTLLGILSGELGRFAMSAAAGRTPSRILLSGIFNEEIVAENLGRQLEYPVGTTNIREQFPRQGGSADDPPMAVPIGLALKAAETDSVGMDFRREEFAYQKKFDRVKIGLFIALLAVNLLLALMLLKFAGDRNDSRAAHATILEKQAGILQSVFPKETLKDQNRLRQQLADLRKEEETKIGGGGYPIEKSALTFLKDLFDAISEFKQKNLNQKFLDEDLYVKLERVEVNQSKNEMTLKGVAVNASCAEALRNAIARKEAFKHAELGSVTPTKENRINFSITAKFGEAPK